MFICLSQFEVNLFKVSFCLAFFVAVRVSELVSPARDRPGGLSRDDVLVVQEAVWVRIRRFKTDVFGHGVWLLLNRVGGILCPVASVSGYLELRFSATAFPSHKNGAPLTRFQFPSVFSKCLSALGLDKKEFGTHLFCIGAATEAARVDLPDGDIRKIGRWRSTCYASYVWPDLLI